MRLTDSTLALPDQLNLHRSYVLTTNPLKPHALTYSAAWHAPPSKGKGHLSCSFGASQQKHTCLLFQVKKSNGILFSSEWKIWVTIYCNCQNSFFSIFFSSGTIKHVYEEWHFRPDGAAVFGDMKKNRSWNCSWTLTWMCSELYLLCREFLLVLFW